MCYKQEAWNLCGINWYGACYQQGLFIELLLFFATLDIAIARVEVSYRFHREKLGESVNHYFYTEANTKASFPDCPLQNNINSKWGWFHIVTLCLSFYNVTDQLQIFWFYEQIELNGRDTASKARSLWVSSNCISQLPAWIAYILCSSSYGGWHKIMHIISHK